METIKCDDAAKIDDDRHQWFVHKNFLSTTTIIKSLKH